MITSFNYAYAIDNNCSINPIHILQIKSSLGCIEDRLDKLENTSSGDLTTASNLGSGSGVFASEVGNDLQFKSLVAGNNTSLSSNSTNITIHSLITGMLSGFNGVTTTSVLKTNIGTSFVDLYPCGTLAQAINCLQRIDCKNMKQFTVIFGWDYDGTGNQQFRIVDFSNDANVLWTSPTFTSDQNLSADGIWREKPTWCTSESQLIQAQGKSTVATDDPTFYFYEIYTR